MNVGLHSTAANFKITMNRKQLIYIKWLLSPWFTPGRKHHVELQVLGRSHQEENTMSNCRYWAGHVSGLLCRSRSRRWWRRAMDASRTTAEIFHFRHPVLTHGNGGSAWCRRECGGAAGRRVVPSSALSPLVDDAGVRCRYRL
jgi:hypothetical protein